ncbi:hypothetical protein DW910_18510 [Bacteroides eggerthii]|nr:hypothetical protein DW910_18510 [Bacteroides eggerthii]
MKRGGYVSDGLMNLSGSRFDVLRFFGKFYPMKMIAGTGKVSVSMVRRQKKSLEYRNNYEGNHVLQFLLCFRVIK